MWSSPEISSAVATLVAIMQNASCGVRTWIACQFRFSTSTIVLFRMSLIKCLHTATAHCAREVFVLCFFRWLLSSLNVCKIGCLAWFCSKSSGFRDRCTPDYATRQWSPGKVLPLRLLGVSQTRSYFTTGRNWLPWLESHQHSRLQRAPSYDSTTRQCWWPARVTLPVQRIKSPLHHFNACRPK